MDGKPAGMCQVCDRAVEGYSREALIRPLGDMKRLPPPGAMFAEPCGHEQPESVIFPGHTPTYPVRGRLSAK